MKELLSGRRHYLCRLFVLDSGATKSLGPTVVVVMERAHQMGSLVSVVVEQFHLTAREEEVVRLLLRGLTSKEIAKRMGISPNTVKAFLRLVMVKMGVSTRAAILGRVLEQKIPSDVPAFPPAD